MFFMANNDSETMSTGQYLFRKIKDFNPKLRLKFSFYYNDVQVSYHGGTERVGEICEIHKREKWFRLSQLVEIREYYDNPPQSMASKNVRVFDKSLVALVQKSLKYTPWIVEDGSTQS